MDSLPPNALVITASTDAEGHLLGQPAAVDEFVMVRDVRVYEILERNLFVRPIMDDGIRVARSIFGAACAIAIEVYEDRSGGDDLQIFVMLRPTADEDVARDLLDRFDSSWWIEHVAATHGVLAFALEYE